jgi:hypothetical protein
MCEPTGIDGSLPQLGPRHVENSELEFMARYSGQEFDLGAVRQHLHAVWRRLVAGWVCRCVRS